MTAWAPGWTPQIITRTALATADTAITNRVTVLGKVWVAFKAAVAKL